MTENVNIINYELLAA